MGASGGSCMPSGGEDGTRTSFANWGQWRWPQPFDPPRSLRASSREVGSGARHKVTGSFSKHRGIQISPSIHEFTGANGSNAEVSGICSPPHASHPVVHEVSGICSPPHASHPLVPEAAFSPHNPHVCVIRSLSVRISSTCSCDGQTGSTCPRECSTPPSLSLRTWAWRGGVATVLCPGQAQCFTVTSWQRMNASSTQMC